jgi:hypothetical protein
MWYAPLWLSITLPEVVLLGLGSGCVFALLERRAPSPAMGLVIIAALFPLVYIVLARAPIYDGPRHLLFVVPTLTILAVCGLHAWRDRVGSRLLVPVVVAFAMMLGAVQIAQLHPYQTTYFNRFTGGLSGAEHRYTLDYWGSTSKESAEWLTENQGETGRLCVTAELSQSWELYLPRWTVEDTVSLKACPSWSVYAYAFARNRWLDEAADYALKHPSLWRPVHHIERQGARLGTVFKNQQPSSR